MIILAEKGVFHSDIKLENIVLCNGNYVDTFILYLIDFGGVSFDFKLVYTCTKRYFCKSEKESKLFNEGKLIF